MINFIHTADAHFGVENYGKIDARTGVHTRLLDFYRAFNACVQYAIKNQVDFFLFCGDAYKTASPSPTQQKLLVHALVQLHRAGIPVVAVVGNHDHPLTFGKAHALDILSNVPVSGFHVFNKPGILRLNTKNGPIQIVGIPWPTRTTISLSTTQMQVSTGQITQYISQKIGQLIRGYAQELNPQEPAILAAHLTVSSGTFSGSEKRAVYGTDPLFLPSQLAIEPFDYVALGHLHRHQNAAPKESSIPIVYAGSIERIDFGEATEDKGFCHVHIPAKGQAKYTFIPIAARRFIKIELTLSPGNHTQQILEQIEKQQIAGAVVKIIYNVPLGMRDEVDLKQIQHACQNAQCVIGIIPIKASEHKERRSIDTQNIDLEHLLLAYFISRADYKELAPELVRKTLALKHLCHEHQGLD